MHVAEAHPVFASLYACAGRPERPGRKLYKAGGHEQMVTTRETLWVQCPCTVQQLESINRRYCREIFEKRFSVERMTSDYVSVYWRLQTAKRLPVAIGSD